MNIVIIFFVVLGCLTPALYFFQLHSFKRRPSLSREDMLRAYGVEESDYDFLIQILSEIEKNYRIDCRKIRPTDSFDENLSHLDSWVFDAGNEALSDILQDIGVTEFDGLRTVKDVTDIYIKMRRTSATSDRILKK